jgi:hypothetical protein
MSVSGPQRAHLSPAKRPSGGATESLARDFALGRCSVAGTLPVVNTRPSVARANWVGLRNSTARAECESLCLPCEPRGHQWQDDSMGRRVHAVGRTGPPGRHESVCACAHRTVRTGVVAAWRADGRRARLGGGKRAWPSAWWWSRAPGRRVAGAGLVAAGLCRRRRATPACSGRAAQLQARSPLNLIRKSHVLG